MATHFAQDLETLKKSLIDMAAAVEANIKRGASALIDRKAESVDEIVSSDAVIDQFELDIDHQCHLLLALHHPVANDLRFILTCTKVNNELERMGDHAKRLAKAARALEREEPLPVYDDLRLMADRVITMVGQALDAFIRSDAELAQQVWDSDDLVDEVFVRTLNDTTEAIANHNDRVAAGLRIVAAARDLERIGDIATNIAKDVIFLVHGTNVAHRHLQQTGN